jgi:broad specificity phosphatase PhoE
MSVLYLVRHGKAADFAAGDYDQLAPVGEEQARRLAAHWTARAPLLPDAVFVGPRKRQAQTHDIVRRAYVARELAWPDPVVLEELDEHDGFSVVLRAMPEVARSDDVVARLLAKMATGAKPTNDEALETFRRVVRRWVRGEVSHDAVESWTAFRARVASALEHMRAVGRKKTIVAFTSAGAIAAAVGHALGVGDEKVLDLSWSLLNGSVTELAFSDAGWGLSRFNTTSHLDDSGLITFV